MTNAKQDNLTDDAKTKDEKFLKLSRKIGASLKDPSSEVLKKINEIVESDDIPEVLDSIPEDMYDEFEDALRREALKTNDTSRFGNLFLAQIYLYANRHKRHRDILDQLLKEPDIDKQMEILESSGHPIDEDFRMALLSLIRAYEKTCFNPDCMEEMYRMKRFSEKLDEKWFNKK